MMATKVRLYYGQLDFVLDLAAGLVHDAAERIASNARRGIMVEGIPGDVALAVVVEDSHTDRPKSTVKLAHPSGMAVQAKHGVLTAGASGAGFEVSG